MRSLSERVAETLTWSEARTGDRAVAAALAAARAADESVLATLRDADLVVWTGAGSSYYLALAAAWTQREETGQAAVAAPLSELLLRPRGIIGDGDRRRQALVVVSRSGSTSEAVAVADRYGGLGHPTVALTCRPNSPLAAVTGSVVVSPEGDERAVVMTRSFTSMLALALRVVARIAPDPALGRDLDDLPVRWAEAKAALPTAWRLADPPPRRVVALGGGAAAGITEELCLKLTEASRITAQAWHPLEFRHGPLSVCEPGVVVLAFPGGPGATDELEVVTEAVELGSSAWVLGPGAVEWAAARDRGRGRLATSDIGTGLHHAARLPLLMLPIQAFALGVAIARGADPDRPRHLSQVVLLEQ